MQIHTQTDFHSPVRHRALYTPWTDVLLLGGGSVIALLIFKMLRLSAESVAQLAIVMLVVANFVNHPHFAYSYQLFYGSWKEVKNGAMPADLTRRWCLAGFIAPIALALGLMLGALLWLNGQPLVLGIGLNLMGLLVGWHYAKQGFGMAMMDAAFKKRYWPAAARKAMLMNAYACWVATWTLGNSTQFARELWGVFGLVVNVPGVIVIAACTVAAGTTAWCGLALYRAIKQWHEQQFNWKQMPLAGLTGYFVTLYLWMGLISLDPAFVLTVPFFHSLQYLTVIGRYKVNEAKSGGWTRGQLAGFALTGAVLGAIGFWLMPAALDYARTGKIPEIGSPALAVACFWIFINVHHYLIDNVLWRQGNPKVKQYLFDA
ncbi:hypothetical protein [Massilia sp. Root351]|uniref:hypothetical protein n=1 Tax=Massilia sp. Root351 TaxID=1736522 RepID=UPI000A45A2E0|nr:hypothetical protein [Massilia sp. Root351]